jgi:ribosomal protein S18 acetylase RimI-like enzyme
MTDFDWFSIRRVRLNDLPSIYKIDSTSLVSNFSVDGMLERIVLYNDYSLVATENATNKVIGYIIGTENTFYTKEFPGGYVYLSRFAVKNEYRRRGVGTTLLVMLENHLLMSGKCLGIVADVRRSNIPSLTFFDKNNYTHSVKLSQKEGYERGDTPDDRYKIVIYRKFLPIDNYLRT